MTNWEKNREARFATWPQKSCEQCEAPLTPKHYASGVWEVLRGFERRRFCDLLCATRAARKGSESSKICSRCTEEKPLTEFPLKGGLKSEGKRYGYCKVCHTDYQRKRKLWFWFHLTEADYETIEKAQNGGCAICGRPAKEDRRLAVDHNHKTGLVRGLLCWICNKTVGLFHDDAGRFQKLVEYLENPPATKALGEERYGLPGRTNTKKQRKFIDKLKRDRDEQYKWLFENGEL